MSLEIGDVKRLVREYVVVELDVRFFNFAEPTKLGVGCDDEPRVRRIEDAAK